MWLLIQIIELYQSKNGSGISLLAFVILLISAVIWFVYGCFVLPDRNYVLVISGSISFVFSVIMIVGILMYSDGGGGPAAGVCEIPKK
jgi:uncharacterized protein with PQ loop repeat